MTFFWLKLFNEHDCMFFLFVHINKKGRKVLFYLNVLLNLIPMCGGDTNFRLSIKHCTLSVQEKRTIYVHYFNFHIW